MSMGWNPFRVDKLTTRNEVLAEIDEAARREQVYRLAQQAEDYAARLLAKTKALREELERGPDA